MTSSFFRTSTACAMEPDGRLLFTVLIRRNRLSTLFTGAEAFHEMDHLVGKLFIDYLSPLKQQRIRQKVEKLDRLRSRA